MCYTPLNKCSNSTCKREETLPVRHCDRAKERKKLCDSLPEEDVAKGKRQSCARCIASQSSEAPDKKRPASKIGSASSQVRSSSRSSNDARRPDTRASKSRSESTHSRGSDIDQVVRTSSIAKVTPSMNKLSVDDEPLKYLHKDALRLEGTFTFKPKDLFPESPEWQVWRDNPPSAKDDMLGDSRNARYEKAVKSHGDRRWPLPYEPMMQYPARQIQKAKRPFVESYLFHDEYIGWRMEDPDLGPTDDQYYQDFLMASAKREMARRGYPNWPEENPFANAGTKVEAKVDAEAGTRTEIERKARAKVDGHAKGNRKAKA